MVERRPADPETVARLHSQGLDDQKIANKLGCHRTTVRSTRIRLGLPAIKRAHGRRRIVDAKIATLLRERGMKQRQIAELFGVSQQSVSYALKLHKANQEGASLNQR